jgi:putative nucleotidyltransferase with HDIG domain
LNEASSADRPGPDRPLVLFVVGIVALGVYVLGEALLTIGRVPIDGYAVLLAVLTVLAGRFVLKMPGYPATVSVSELFVFASILLFGPAPAILTVALDGLSVSVTQVERRLHRTLFNVAEPAISVWAAAHVLFALLPTGPLAHLQVSAPDLLLPTVAMATTYFLLNTGLTAAALSLESGRPIVTVWRPQALFLGLNYFAGASLASFAVSNRGSLNLAMLGLGLPILALSYAAYKAASGRLEEAEEHMRHTNQLYSSTVEMLAIAVDAKDRVTHGHVRRVQRHTLAVAKALGTPETELKAIEAASLLHDLGKIAIPDYVLNKPGGLSTIEYERIKTHAKIGATILQAVDFPYPIAPIVRHHHENWNGTGYPDKLAGTDIPIGARIIAVVDCFDAVTSDRPYRRRMTDEQALAILQERRGSMYDPDVVDGFVRLLPELRMGDAAACARALASPVSYDFEYQSPATSLAPTAETTRNIRMFQANGPDIGDRIRRVIPEADACLFAIDTEGGRLVAANATSRIRGMTAAPDLRLGDGLLGWVAANRQTIVNSDPNLDFGDAACQLGLHTCLCIPVFGFGTIAGVLGVYASRNHRFSPGDVEVLGSLVQERAFARPIEEPLEWSRSGRERDRAGAAA